MGCKIQLHKKNYFKHLLIFAHCMIVICEIQTFYDEIKQKRNRLWHDFACMVHGSIDLLKIYSQNYIEWLFFQRYSNQEIIVSVQPVYLLDNLNVSRFSLRRNWQLAIRTEIIIISFHFLNSDLTFQIISFNIYLSQIVNCKLIGPFNINRLVGHNENNCISLFLYFQFILLEHIFCLCKCRRD